MDSDFIEIWLQLNKPKKAFELVEYWIERSPIWSSTSLLKIVEYCFTAQGPAQAYLMYQGAIVAHEILLTYLHVVTVGAALCEMVDDHQSYFHHLQLCVDLGESTASALPRVGKAVRGTGDLERAKTIAELELKLSGEWRRLMAFAGSLLAFCIRTLEWCIGPTLSLAVWRTRSLILAERYLDAVAYSDPQLSTWPDSARLHYCAGRAALALVKRDYARCRMAYAATLNPAEPKYRFGLAYCAQLLGQVETAEREYLAVLERTPAI